MASNKKHKFREYEVSPDRKCIDCGRPIKMNVLARVPKVCRCYVCFLIKKGKVVAFSRKGRKYVLKERQAKLKATYFNRPS